MQPLILLVDDESPIRLLVSAILRQKGYRILMAQDGVAAITIAQREHPELVILDFLMPGMVGADVCRIIKQGRTTSQIKVVILTAVIDRATRQLAKAAGADAYLTKPFVMEELLELVEGVLGSPAQLSLSTPR